MQKTIFLKRTVFPIAALAPVLAKQGPRNEPTLTGSIIKKCLTRFCWLKNADGPCMNRDSESAKELYFHKPHQFAATVAGAPELGGPGGHVPLKVSQIEECEGVQLSRMAGF